MWNPTEFRNMNFPAPVAVLGFLAAVAGIVLSALAAVTFLFVRKAQWAQRVATLVAAGAVVYFVLLLGMSLASREVTLTPGQEKYFCEIDCHLAYSIIASRAELAGSQRELRVLVRTRFDENTISSQRPKNAPLTPNPRHVLVVDGQGRNFEALMTAGTPLTRALIPGESYETEFVFRIPADAANLRLLVTNPGWEEHLVIGDENSFGHEKTYLAVPVAGLDITVGDLRG